MIYRCYYTFTNTNTYQLGDTATYCVEAESIGQVSSGFWINDQFLLTTGSDCKWWIPPSSIKIVEKVDTE